MTVMTLPGVVIDGQIRLADDVRLPENAKVYVVIPSIESPPIAQISSPRLAHLGQAVDFNKVVVEENQDAGVRR